MKWRANGVVSLQGHGQGQGREGALIIETLVTTQYSTTPYGYGVKHSDRTDTVRHAVYGTVEWAIFIYRTVIWLPHVRSISSSYM